MSKKICILFMNCHGWEIIRHINSSKKFNDIYDTYHIMTHGLTAEDFNNRLNEFKICDLLITHNIKNYPGMNYADLLKIVKPECEIIKLEYWRFNGFWPIESTTGANGQIWHIPNEFGNITAEEYIDKKIDPEIIQKNFKNECYKLKKIDGGSDIGIYDYFISNYKTNKLFSDYNHPTAKIFRYVSEKILERLKISDSISIFNDDCCNNNRVRLISNQTAQVLDLNWDIDNIFFLNKYICRKVYYEFTNTLYNYFGHNISYDDMVSEYKKFTQK